MDQDMCLLLNQRVHENEFHYVDSSEGPRYGTEQTFTVQES